VQLRLALHYIMTTLLFMQMLLNHSNTIRHKRELSSVQCASHIEFSLVAEQTKTTQNELSILMSTVLNELNKVLNGRKVL